MESNIRVIVLAAAMAAMFGVYADTEVVDGIEWTYVRSAGESSIFNSSYSSAIPVDTSGAISVPSTLGGCPVTSIGDLAFAACSGLTSVTIPAGVTSIGDSAFVACTGLTSVTMPGSVTSIGRYAFAACSGIRSVVIPQCVCSGQLSSVFPSAYLSITNVVVLDGVTAVGDFAFKGCSALSSVTIPDSLTSIGEDAFAGCGSSLFDTTTIPGVRMVDGWAVGYDVGDMSDDLDLSAVRGIGDYAFAECDGLKSVAIPGNVKRIGNAAFCYCFGLTNVQIETGVTSIGEWAFSSCVELTDVTICASVTNIGYAAFCYCDALTNVVFTGNEPTVADSAFQDVGPDCVARISQSKWPGVVEGQSWHGLTIKFQAEGNLVISIVDLTIDTTTQGGVPVRRMTVGVVAMDGETPVSAAPAEVAAMFEATSDLSDWNGAAKLTPTVEVLEQDGTTMRFRVTPGDGTSQRAFLRICN